MSHLNAIFSKISLKIIMLGDQGVGKTSLLRRFVNNKFNIKEKATIGADFTQKKVKLKGHSPDLQIWDTAGLERFSTLNKSFYRGTDHVIIVYDVTNGESMDNIKYWMDQFIEEVGDDDFRDGSFTIVANKIDEEKSIVRNYKSKDLEKYRKMGIKIFNCSAKLGTNVKKMFHSVASCSLENYLRDNTYDDEIAEIFQKETRAQVILPTETTSGTSSLDKCLGCGTK